MTASLLSNYQPVESWIAAACPNCHVLMLAVMPIGSPTVISLQDSTMRSCPYCGESEVTPL